MQPKRLQRTLIVGLGESGTRVTDLFLAQLAQALGQVDVVEGISVCPETDSKPELSNIGSVLSISPEAAFADWQEAFKELVEAALRRISKVIHLTEMARRGLSLHRPDEVHLIVAADLTAPWVCCALEIVVHFLQNVVTQTLACHTGVTGILLLVADDENDALAGEADGQVPELPQLADCPFDEVAIKSAFDRGCFLVSAANEAGLVVGGQEQVARRVAQFLTLALTSPLGDSLTESDWHAGMASLGLAVLSWPGQALVDALSARWAGEMLNWLTASNHTSHANQPATSEAAARQLIMAQRLAPPLLLEDLVSVTPPLPDTLVNCVPDPPWPWALAEVQAKMETTAQHWRENWRSKQSQLVATLEEIEAAWQTSAQTWLTEQVDRPAKGVLPQTQELMAAVVRLLVEFAEGVAARLEEAEADLAKLDRHKEAIAEKLTGMLEPLPNSTLATLLLWGLKPASWMKHWKQCRQAQVAARQYAFAQRNWLAARQAVWLYRDILLFYEQVASNWAELLAAWEGCFAEITSAGRSPELVVSAEDLKAILGASGGPWTTALVEKLYQNTAELAEGAFLNEIGPLSRWVQKDLTALGIQELLRDYASLALYHLADLPVDAALARQLPNEDALADWLAALVDQASPFWRFDETTMAEVRRSQAYLDRWLLLPDGENSPLAPLCRKWPHPPTLVTGNEPGELIAVTIRRGIETRLGRQQLTIYRR